MPRSLTLCASRLGAARSGRRRGWHTPPRVDYIVGHVAAEDHVANLELYAIRSVDDERYKLSWNIAHRNRLTNLVTEENRDGFYLSRRDAGETDATARALDGR